MQGEFPITRISPEWELGPEEMGSKRKFWYRPAGDQARRWLFKYPKSGTGQHWAEKLAAEIARLLGVPRAEVELAEYNETRGSISKSFVMNDLELVHGNQILLAYNHGYDTTRKKFNQVDHTVTNVFTSLDNAFVNDEAKQKAKLLFAEYLVLDAVIGNTDRHHENWGVLRKQEEGNWLFLAPSFDHASSLGRELRDDTRARFLMEDRVGRYVERGHGAVFWSADAVRSPCPLQLVRRAAPAWPELFRPALGKVDRLENQMDTLLRRMPAGWMSPRAMEFAATMIQYSIGQLREVLP